MAFGEYIQKVSRLSPKIIRGLRFNVHPPRRYKFMRPLIEAGLRVAKKHIAAGRFSNLRKSNWVFVSHPMRSVTWRKSRGKQSFTHLILTIYEHFLLYFRRAIVASSVYDPKEVATLDALNFKLGIPLPRSLSGRPL